MAGWVEIVAAAAVSGLGATWLEHRWAVKTHRRIRRDEEREAALQDLIDATAELEQQVDVALSPRSRSHDGIIDTQQLMAAEGMVRNVERIWRSRAAPYLPVATAGPSGSYAMWGTRGTIQSRTSDVKKRLRAGGYEVV